MTGSARATRWPRRTLIVALSFIASMLAYTDRVNLSVAAVAMREQYGWSQTQKGFVLSAFFIGYLVFMFIGALLAARLGGKRVLGWSVVLWSAFTMATPVAAGCSMPVLIAARIGMGVGEAAMFPAAYELFGRWIPAGERARGAAWLLSGIPVGTLVGLTASGWLVANHGWPSAFYVFGVAGLVWAVAWFRWVENDPAKDPRVGAAERALLAGAEVPASRLGSREYRRLLLSAPAASIAIAHFATTWNLYVLIAWLPSYFRDALGVGIADAALFSAVPWLTMFASSNVAAAIADRLIVRGVGVTFVRKLMQTVSLVGCPALLLVMRGVHSAQSALALLCVAMAALGCSNAGFAPAMLDIAPRHSAVLYGFSNTFATLPGIIGVAAIGWLVDVTGTYSAGLVLTAGVGFAGALAFALLFRARPLVD